MYHIKIYSILNSLGGGAERERYYLISEFIPFKGEITFTEDANSIPRKLKTNGRSYNMNDLPNPVGRAARKSRPFIIFRSRRHRLLSLRVKGLIHLPNSSSFSV